MPSTSAHGVASHKVASHKVASHEVASPEMAFHEVTLDVTSAHISCKRANHSLGLIQHVRSHLYDARVLDELIYKYNPHFQELVNLTFALHDASSKANPRERGELYMYDIPGGEVTLTFEQRWPPSEEDEESIAHTVNQVLVGLGKTGVGEDPDNIVMHIGMVVTQARDVPAATVPAARPAPASARSTTAAAAATAAATAATAAADAAAARQHAQAHAVATAVGGLRGFCAVFDGGLLNLAQHTVGRSLRTLTLADISATVQHKLAPLLNLRLDDLFSLWDQAVVQRSPGRNRYQRGGATHSLQAFYAALDGLNGLLKGGRVRVRDLCVDGTHATTGKATGASPVLSWLAVRRTLFQPLLTSGSDPTLWPYVIDSSLPWHWP